MRWLPAVLAAATLVLTGCRNDEPVPAGDLDSIESTLNSVESELDEP